MKRAPLRHRLLQMSHLILLLQFCHPVPSPRNLDQWVEMWGHTSKRLTFGIVLCGEQEQRQPGWGGAECVYVCGGVTSRG